MAQYNVSTPTGDELRARYHFSEADIRRTKRVIYSEGSWDPIRVSGPPAEWFPLSSDLDEPRLLTVQLASHTEDLELSLPSDPETLWPYAPNAASSPQGSPHVQGTRDEETPPDADHKPRRRSPQ